VRSQKESAWRGKDHGGRISSDGGKRLHALQGWNTPSEGKGRSRGNFIPFLRVSEWETQQLWPVGERRRAGVEGGEMKKKAAVSGSCVESAQKRASKRKRGEKRGEISR